MRELFSGYKFRQDITKGPILLKTSVLAHQLMIEVSHSGILQHANKIATVFSAPLLLWIRQLGHRHGC